MANFKKNKKKTNPTIACIEKQINNAREESGRLDLPGPTQEAA